MRAPATAGLPLMVLALALSAGLAGAEDHLTALQSRFDREAGAVRKAKLLEKLGDAQFQASRHAGKAGDDAGAAVILEKYRDNVRAALDALKKQHPNAEKQSNGYRQLEIHVRKGIREVEQAMLASPEPYKPPLEIVRKDLIAMDDELLHLLFPLRPPESRGPSPSPEKQP